MNTENNHYPEKQALNGKATKLMVLLHGVGSDGHDLISLVPYINQDLPDYHFISPHAVEEYDMAPFGYQWFSLIDRNPETLQKLAEKNSPLLQMIIQKKQQELNLTNKDTVILGFSQGTMIGSYLTLTQKDPFFAMVAFSGRLIEPTQITNTKTPFCIIHGEDDEVVPADESEKMANYCTKHQISHKQLFVPHIGHSIDGKGMKFALDFLRNNNN